MTYKKLSKDFREKCEWYSLEYRKQLNLKVHKHLKGEVLAKHLNIHVFQPHEMPVANDIVHYLAQAKDWSGIIIHFDPTIILYNPNMTDERIQSTIMHELAHIILKHPNGRLYLAPSGEFKRDFNSQKEAEANYLGSCLQIPRLGLQWCLQKGWSKEKLSNQFKASIQMVQWRINATMY